MLKLISANSTLAWILLAGLLVWTPCHATAEPISAGDDAAATAAAQPKEIAQALDKFRQRDFQGALKLLREAEKKNPDQSPALVLMAQLFGQANIPQEMQKNLELAVVENPDDPEAYVILGDLAFLERRVAEADLLYAKANSLLDGMKSEKRKESLRNRVLLGKASVAESRENWTEAQNNLEALLKADPKNIRALQRLGRSLFKQGKPDEALNKLKEAGAIDADMEAPEAILAQFFEQEGDRQNAKKWMIAALNAAPKNIRTRLSAAEWAFKTEQLDEALKQVDVALKLDPKSFDAKLLRGLVALFKRDYPAAETYFESAHLQSPSNFAATNNLALALMEQKDEAKRRRALEYAKGNLQQNPKYAEAASTYGWALYRLGHLEEAEKALQAAISSGTFSADTAYYLARVFADRGGREPQVKQLLELALGATGPFANRQEAKTLLEQIDQQMKAEKK